MEPSPVDVIRGYHQRTKHHLKRYAAGPDALDWEMQPDPFRRYADSPTIELPLGAEGLTTTYDDLFHPGAVAAAPLTVENVAALFALGLGLAAWKEYGGDRWALRCNPSSGNLHPTEGYLVSGGLAGIGAGVYHYAPHDHLLEQRCALPDGLLSADTALLGLSSVHERESWKYGERAFRYCQHDVGHAIAALRLAAGCLGWQLRLLDGAADATIARLLGLDRADDFTKAEREHPDCLLLLSRSAGVDAPELSALAEAAGAAAWNGTANRLSREKPLPWPAIKVAARACAKPATAAATAIAAPLPPLPEQRRDLNAAALIRQRRSGQSFDGQSGIAAETLYRLLDRLLPRAEVAPWDCWSLPPRVHPVLFLHRVEGLAAGLYALPRHAEAETLMRDSFLKEFDWQRPEGCPDHLPLYHLVSADARNTARTISCHQQIASASAFSLGMLAQFDAALEEGPWAYRTLYWEAGMLGQVLYLEAEAAGLRGTGIGCFFDDAFHEITGVGDTRLQDIYHFTVGGAFNDTRLATLPPYAHLPPNRAHNG